MGMMNILYDFIVYPGELLFEIIFSLINKIIDNPGFSIIVLGTVFSFAMLPLYSYIYKQQENIITCLNKKGEISVKLMNFIPYFFQLIIIISFYYFTKNLYLLNDNSFYFIDVLNLEDALFHFGEISINIFPIIYFIIVISTTFFIKRNGLKISKIVISAESLSFSLIFYNTSAAFWLFFLINAFWYAFFKLCLFNFDRKICLDKCNNHVLFYACSGLMLILLGLLIPLSVISVSAAEFENASGDTIKIIIKVFVATAGFLFLWLGFVYALLSQKGKKIYQTVLWCSFGIFFLDFLFLGNNLGLISTDLLYDSAPAFSFKAFIINILLACALTALFLFIKSKYEDFAKVISIVLCIGLFFISGIYFKSIKDDLANVRVLNYSGGNESEPTIPLSTEGNNVFVIVLDRAFGPYIPFIMEDVPELLEKFDGFTYYPNTLSFGLFTNYAVSSIYGGYEYTPAAMNNRSDESLKDKHNEALKLMPLLFKDNGYEVSVFDPPYVNYRLSGDLSIFKRYSDINSYTILGYYTSDLETEIKETSNELRERNFICYSWFRVLPEGLKEILYDNGDYLSASPTLNNGATFMEHYTMLDNLTTMTEVIDSDTDTFFSMYNMITHEPYWLNSDFEPTLYTDEDPFNGITEKTVNGVTMKLENWSQIVHYQANVAAMKLLGNWFDYLRDAGVYDNSRIIIVGDHGRNFEQFENMIFNDTIDVDIEWYNPLLLVKDFNSTGFTTSDEFMTNADVPTIAFDGVIDNPINPFTGNLITNEAKYSEPLLVTAGDVYETTVNNGNVFDDGGQPWYQVTGNNIFEEENWSYYTPEW